jgi:hypothetical protein
MRLQSRLLSGLYCCRKAAVCPSAGVTACWWAHPRKLTSRMCDCVQARRVEVHALRLSIAVDSCLILSHAKLLEAGLCRSVRLTTRSSAPNGRTAPLSPFDSAFHPMESQSALAAIHLKITLFLRFIYKMNPS